MIELIFGGAASGKSEYAEMTALKKKPPFYYLATMRHGSSTGDRRIEKHVKRRGSMPFITIEYPVDIGLAADRVSQGTVLLECVTNLAANELFPADTDLSEEHDRVFWQDRSETVYQKIVGDIEGIIHTASDLIAVSGDIMRDGVIYSPMTETYIELVARLNTYLAVKSDKVYEVIYSCVKRIK